MGICSFFGILHTTRREHECFCVSPTSRSGRRPSDDQREYVPWICHIWDYDIAATQCNTTRYAATQHIMCEYVATFLQLLLRHACLGLLIIGLLNIVTSDLCLARPANSLQSLSQDWVAVVVGRVHPVGIHGRKVLDLELNERRSEFGGVAELVREGIYEKG